MIKSRLVFAVIGVLGLSGACAAASLQPPKFVWGDAWTFDTMVITRGVAKAPERIEHGVLWRVPGGKFLTGERASGGSAWNPLERIADNACRPFVGYDQDSLDERFCDGASEPGRQLASTMAFGKRLTTFEGTTSLKLPMGTFEAERFVMVDTLEYKPGEKVFPAKQVRSELWYVPQLRGFVRLHGQTFGDGGKVLEEFRMDLVSVDLKECPEPCKRR